VFLGLLWLTFLQSERCLYAFSRPQLGLLFFLGIDSFAEALELPRRPGVAHAIGVIVIRLCLAFSSFPREPAEQRIAAAAALIPNTRRDLRSRSRSESGYTSARACGRGCLRNRKRALGAALVVDS